MGSVILQWFNFFLLISLRQAGSSWETPVLCPKIQTKTRWIVQLPRLPWVTQPLDSCYIINTRLNVQQWHSKCHIRSVGFSVGFWEEMDPLGMVSLPQFSHLYNGNNDISARWGRTKMIDRNPPYGHCHRMSHWYTKATYCLFEFRK